MKHINGLEVMAWDDTVVRGVDASGKPFTAESDLDLYTGDSCFLFEGVRYYRKEFETQPPVIHRMLELSTAHLSPETMHFLDNQDFCSPVQSIILFEKKTFGYFIPIIDEQYMADKEWPADLMNVIRFAEAHGCTWIMLDSDGAFVDGLPRWDYDEDQ